MLEKSFGNATSRRRYRSDRLLAAICVLFAVFSIAGAWLVSTQPPEIRSSVESFLRILATPKVLAALALVSVVTGYVMWSFLTFYPRAGRIVDYNAALRREGRQLAIAFALFTLALAVVGILFARDLERTNRAERLSQQAAIAELKARDVDQWLLERSLDTELLATSLKPLPLDRLATEREARQFVDVLIGEFLAKNVERTAVSLLAPDGKVLVHVGEGAEPDKRTMSEALAAAGAIPRKLRIVDVHLDEASQPRMSFVLPIAIDTAAADPLAILVTAIDPSQLLFPDIQRWPTASPSSEVLLATRQGNDVVYLTPPRFLPSKPGPLAFRLPIVQANPPPESAAVIQDNGVRVGPDYRGVVSLTASHHVIGLPWVAIAQTDREEVNRPLNRKATTVVLVVASIVFVAAAMFLMLWSEQRATLETFRDQQQEERKVLVEHFAGLVQLSRDIVLLRDPDGNIVEANDEAEKAYQYSAEELRRLNMRDLCPDDDRPPVARRHAEQIHRRKDGTFFPVEITGRAFDVDGKRYRQSFIRDITGRKKLEAEVARLSRVKHALQAATSVLLHAGTELEIYEQVCRVLVEFGNYKLADVAAPNHDAGKTVRFLASSGHDDGYLAGAHITWGEGPLSEGPTGSAIKTGEIAVNQNFKDNARMVPWRDAALKRGFQSSICLPIKVAGETVAALTLYSEQPSTFDKEEVALLSALADDISYAAAKLRERTGRTEPQ